MENLKNMKYYKSKTWTIKHVGVQLKQCINFLITGEGIQSDYPKVVEIKYGNRDF